MAIVSENAIWERLIQPHRGALPVEAAQYFLGLAFADADMARLRELFTVRTPLLRRKPRSCSRIGRLAFNSICCARRLGKR